jgi:hypothetical protein
VHADTMSAACFSSYHGTLFFFLLWFYVLSSTSYFVENCCARRYIDISPKKEKIKSEKRAQQSALGPSSITVFANP